MALKIRSALLAIVAILDAVGVAAKVINYDTGLIIIAASVGLAAVVEFLTTEGYIEKVLKAYLKKR